MSVQMKNVVVTMKHEHSNETVIVMMRHEHSNEDCNSDDEA